MMRLSLFMLFVSAFHLIATNSEAQNATIQLEAHTISVGQLFTEIEKQTDYLVLYRNRDVNTENNIYLSHTTGKVIDLLTEAFQNTDISFEFENKYILLKKRHDLIELSDTRQPKKKVVGRVTGEDGEPIIGANVSEKGTTNGIITDVDGYFTLGVNENAVIQISYIGYTTQEIRVAGKNNILIQLLENASVLDEVVVVGYGVQQKKLVTGATVQVKGNVIEKQNTSNILTALQSQAPGINASKTSGQPGEASRISIRGVGTIGNSSPLYVVDGIVRYSINDLDPTIIESIDVLKDAASAAIYGARAANGVILVTTKKGRESKPSITYNGYLGWANVYKKVPMANALQYAEMIEEGSRHSERDVPDFASLVPTWESIRNGTFKGTDWFSEAQVHNAPTQRHSLSIRGGNNQIVYSLGYSYFSEEGTIGAPVQAQYDRSTFYANSEIDLIKNDRNRTLVKVGENITYTYYTKNGISTGGFFGNPITTFFRTNPFMENSMTDGEYDFAIPWNSQEPNPVGYMVKTQGYNRHANHNFDGNAYITIEPVRNLVFRSNFGINLNSYHYNNFSPTYNLSTNTIRTEDGTSQNMSIGLGWTFENTIRYDFKLGDHKIDALAGISLESSGGKLSATMNGSNVNNIFGEVKYAYLDNIKNVVEGKTSLGGSPLQEYRLMSYFGRANYTYRDRYLFTAILRADGSSNFAPDKRWGAFSFFFRG
ncbi:MAG: SusC/RagA family TonB-linked outer membrane protein, partial [Tannerellaceae bacterium]|nr:SusC/RagA family TonB-linked outer membrane protein [Tannerellaceae bacterium]